MVFTFLLCYRVLDSVWLALFSHRESAGRSSVSQARTRRGEAKLLLWINNFFFLVSCMCGLNVCAPNFTFYGCPQVMNDVDFELSEACPFGNEGRKEENSLVCSNYINTEGNPDVPLLLIFYCVNIKCFRWYKIVSVLLCHSWCDAGSIYVVLKWRIRMEQIIKDSW